MKNFIYYNPVKIIFGKGMIQEVKNLIDKDKKILMTYGGGSIKRNGIYQQIRSALSEYQIVEFPGIEPNPKYETCMEAVEIVKREKIDFLLAVGGGSVLDGTKFIAAAAKINRSEPWELLMKKLGNRELPDLEAAIPLGCIMTLPATGSEMNCIAVISREETKEKFAFASPKVFPKFSIIDPTATFSLPKRQLINGIVDAYIHTLEQYATYDIYTPLQDRQAEAILKTLIEEAEKILTFPPDYESRATFCWCATQALNGNLSNSVVTDWSTHKIGHELTAIYGLDHAQTLAIVLPRLWEHQKESKADKLFQYGKRIFNIEENDRNKVIDLAIKKTEEFFISIGMKTRFDEYEIDAKEAAELISERFRERRVILGERNDIDYISTKEILSNC